MGDYTLCHHFQPLWAPPNIPYPSPIFNFKNPPFFHPIFFHSLLFQYFPFHNPQKQDYPITEKRKRVVTTN